MPIAPPLPEPPRAAPIRRVIPDRLLTIADVASLAYVSDQTIRDWIRTGQIPAPAKLGRLWRWDPAVIDRWLTERGV